MKIGIAISLYSNFEDLGILLDILRRNFSGQYEISVCSNHPEGRKNIDLSSVDYYTQGDPIRYDRGQDWVNNYTAMNMRVMDCIKKSCGALANKGSSDWIMHVHADAWPLDEGKLISLIEGFDKAGKVFGARGYGYSLYTKRSPVGSFDDMFFFIKRDTAGKTHFFDFDTASLMPHKINMHGMLALLAMAKIGLKDIALYSDYRDMVYWDGKPVLLVPANHAVPMNYQEKTGFLHVNRKSFPDNMGCAIQAHYLRSHHLTKGNAAESFLGQYAKPISEISRELDRYEKKTLGKIKPFIDIAPLGRDFRAIDKERDRISKMGALKRLRLRLNKITGRETGYGVYDDSLWPSTMPEFYRKNVRIEGAAEKGGLWWEN